MRLRIARLAIWLTPYAAALMPASAADPSTVAQTREQEVAAQAGRQVSADSVVRFVQACRKANGAFGPPDQSYTDAAWNFPAVATLKLLQQRCDAPDAVLEHGLGFPTGHAGIAHWHLYHQALLENLLTSATEETDPDMPQAVTLRRQTGDLQYYYSPLGPEQKPLFSLSAEAFHKATRRADTLWFYNLSSLYLTLAALEARGQHVANPDEIVEFVCRQQAPAGGFADVRDDNSAPQDVQAHVATTWHAVASLQLLKSPVPNAAGCIRFVQTCQSDTGGFFSRPAPARYRSEDVYYAWAACRTLAALGDKPTNQAACIAWIQSLQNTDGGFGDKPGWRSRLYSTYYAVDALEALTGNCRAAIPLRTVQPRIDEMAIPAGLRIYQGVHKSPPFTADDIPGLAKRKLNLLGIKLGDWPTSDSMPGLPRSEDLEISSYLSVEAYPHRPTHFGSARLNHVANFGIDPNWTAEQLKRAAEVYALGRQQQSWFDYQQQVIAPLQQLGARIYPEQDFEMEHAYEAYDAGVNDASPTGYRAVLAGFNWGQRDFVRVFPWRERYVDKLTPIADCDAHGDLKKWSPQLDHTRHLFIAAGPSYTDFQEAANAGRVVCVIVAPEGAAAGVTYYGRPAAVAHVKQRVSDWRWWSE